MKRIMSIAMLLCVCALSAQEKPEEAKLALEEKRSFEWPLKFSDRFKKNSTQFFRETSYNHPYFFAGILMAALPSSVSRSPALSQGVRLTWDLNRAPYRWLAGTLIAGFGLKVLGHKLTVANEESHVHTGFMFDYSGMLKNEHCKNSQDA